MVHPTPMGIASGVPPLLYLVELFVRAWGMRVGGFENNTLKDYQYVTPVS